MTLNVTSNILLAFLDYQQSNSRIQIHKFFNLNSFSIIELSTETLMKELNPVGSQKMRSNIQQTKNVFLFLAYKEDKTSGCS